MVGKKSSLVSLFEDFCESFIESWKRGEENGSV